MRLRGRYSVGGGGTWLLRAHEADPLQHAATLRFAQASMVEAYALQKETSEEAVAMWRADSLRACAHTALARRGSCR